ncbi:hypothetical protein B0T14DRAFT_280723 [Immersiella caudata]|uniref:Uncharacterized protein n=1 Tax=Immersiella caudata TaxID=314043 RepID=A0AA39WDP7_9PEZI|nr:hypothetical protein B0T14DRAFT_280723 [Immersiella caudata]
MPGHFANRTRVDNFAGAADHSQMLPDQNPGAQPSRLLTPRRMQPHLRAPRQRPQQPSQSSSLAVAAPTPRRAARLMDGVETLVRKLSRQRLQSPEHSSNTNDQPQLAAHQTPSPSITQVLTPSPSPGSPPSGDRFQPPLPSILCADDNLHNSSQSVSRARDFADQGHGASSINANPKPNQHPVIIEAPILEPDPDCDSMDVLYHSSYAPPFSLNSFPSYIEPAGEPIDIDENYVAGSSTIADEAALIESFRARRRAGTPGGSGRRNVDGIPLRFRLSSEAALRCQNLVLSKPRMRKRKKPSERRDSMAPSETTTVNSTTSSMSVSIPSGPTVSRP